VFDDIRGRDPDVRKLYAHLEAEGLELIGDETRGAVMRAYTAGGSARGEGITVELPHRRGMARKPPSTSPSRTGRAAETARTRSGRTMRSGAARGSRSTG
jgi:hypothetical protein